MFDPIQKKGPLDELPGKMAHAVAHAIPAPDDEGGTVDLIDGKVIPLLERIERNTRRDGAAAAKAGSSLSLSATAIATKPTPSASSHALAQRAPSAPVAEARSTRTSQARDSAPPIVTAHRPTPTPSCAYPTAPAQDIAGAIADATRAQDRNRSAKGQFVAGESKSARALKDAKATDATRGSKKEFLDALDGPAERGGKSWGKEGSGEATDAAGSVVGGPIWGAAMEMKEFAGKMQEDRENSDPNSIKALISKKLQDKTGVTAVMGKLADVQGKAHDKVAAMLGSKKPEPQTVDATPAPKKGGKVRDDRGKFNKAGTATATPAKPVPVKFDTPQSQGGGDGGGMLSLLGDLAGKGLGKLGGKVGGRFGKVLSGAGMLLGGGEGAVGGMLGGAAEGTAGAVGGAAKAGGGMMGKVLGGGMKFLGRAAGPIAALAMNLPDLVSGISEGDAGKTGGAVGGIGGALAGGAAGAALGTAILPGVGTLIGGAIGAFAGDFLGGKAGKAIGGTMFGGVKDSVDGLADSVEGNTKSLDKKDAEPPATGVNWGGGGLMDMLSNAGTSVKRFFTGEKVAPIAGSGDLGSLSAQYESANKGSEAVGYDSTGGTSYGKYQISSKTMPAFMKYAQENNPALYEKLKAAGPVDGGTNGQMAQAWKGAAQDGTMGTTEHDFIKKTHFDPAFQGIQDAGLRDQISGSKALQDVLWSTSVQHGPGQTGGGAANIFNKVYKEGMSQEDLVKAVYAERATKFGRSDAATRDSVVNGRLPKEQAQALAGIAAEKNGTTALAANDPNAPTTPMYVPPPGSKPGGGRSRPAQAPQVAEAQAPVTTATATQPASTAVAQAPQPAQVATLAKPARPAVPGMTSLVAEESSSPMKMPTIPGFDTSKIEGLLAQIAKASEKVADKSDKDTEKGDIPTIPFEFDDTALALMAHDRI